MKTRKYTSTSPRNLRMQRSVHSLVIATGRKRKLFIKKRNRRNWLNNNLLLMGGIVALGLMGGLLIPAIHDLAKYQKEGQCAPTAKAV